MPKVSIIVAVYNVEPYLRRSMDCLLNQTMQDLEFICIDDCSTDGSLEILKEYAQKDSRFKIIESEQNRGAAVARNKGLEVATGEYLGFIDPDDAIDLNYYEELYRKAKDGDFDIVKCVRKNIYPNGKVKIGTLNQEISGDKFYFSYEWTTAIYKASIIRENNITFPNEIRKGQDTVFLFRIILKAKTVAIIDNVFYYYYKRKNSLNYDKIPISSVESDIKANCLIFDDFNMSDLYETDPDKYTSIYAARLRVMISSFAYRSDDLESRAITAKAVIDNLFKCKDIDAVKKKFSYPFLLKYIENKDVKELTKYFNRYHNFSEFSMHNKPWENIFSIKNDNNCHKIITILGLKIAFTIKQKKQKKKILLQCQQLMYLYLGLGAIYTKYPNEDLEIDILFTNRVEIINECEEKIKKSKYFNKLYKMPLKAFRRVNKQIYVLRNNSLCKWIYEKYYKKRIEKIITSSIKTKNYDAIFYSHELPSYLITYLRYLSPEAHFVLYGDGPGLILDRGIKLVNPYRNDPVNPFCKTIIPDEIVALLPHKQEQVFDTSNIPITGTKPEIVKKFISEDTLIQEGINTYTNEILSKYEHCSCKTMLLTTRLEEKFFHTTEEDEISLYVDMIEKYCPEKSLVILKPHPTAKKNILQNIQQKCKKQYYFELLPEELNKYSAEMFAKLVQNLDFVITFQSTATVSLKYLYGTKTENGYEALQKYPVAERINPVLDMYQNINDRIDKWDKKSIIYECDLVESAKKFHENTISATRTRMIKKIKIDFFTKNIFRKK